MQSVFLVLQQVACRYVSVSNTRRSRTQVALFLRTAGHAMFQSHAPACRGGRPGETRPRAEVVQTINYDDSSKGRPGTPAALKTFVALQCVHQLTSVARWRYLHLTRTWKLSLNKPYLSMTVTNETTVTLCGENAVWYVHLPHLYMVNINTDSWRSTKIHSLLFNRYRGVGVGASPGVKAAEA